MKAQSVLRIRQVSIISSNIPTHTPDFSPLMGKTKRNERKLHTNHHDNPRRKSIGIVRRNRSQTVSKKPGLLKIQGPRVAAKAEARPRVPFIESDHVLCVGEGASIVFSLSWHQICVVFRQRTFFMAIPGPCSKSAKSVKPLLLALRSASFIPLIYPS
jgi:hypothetical protein